MHSLNQSPKDPTFVQNPYGFYDRARAHGSIVHWADYGLPCALSCTAANAILRDRRFGRAIPENRRRPVPERLAPFHDVEAHSMLELEPPRHTRLRGLVLRAFTNRRIAAMEPEIAVLCHSLIDALPEGRFDLLAGFAQKLPVIVIARLLGVPETMADDLLAWSHAMVAMYRAGRTRAEEDAAAAAARDFAAFLRGYVAKRRTRPDDDLISHLIAAEEEGDRLSPDEMISTCILLLNAGHEATVHAIGNAVAAILGAEALRKPALRAEALSPARIEATVEEALRFDPPLHLFTRHAYDEIEVMGHSFRPGDEVACLLGAANRDPRVWDAPHTFDPFRPAKPHLAFGAGLHFCVGAPLARLELRVALPILFARLPGLRLTAPPRYADIYHFHGLAELPLAA
ncbi:MAG: cytochrome P450 [Rhodobacteraceae bacterium]|nr:cytochrome P450 [Paracoccaceae bacterium]